jgi:hypothetical protein
VTVRLQTVTGTANRLGGKVMVEGFYVTVRSGSRVGYLLGPYASHADALASVDRARLFAGRLDPWAVFYAFGTARVVAETASMLRPGRFNDEIGLYGPGVAA